MKRYISFFIITMTLFILVMVINCSSQTPIKIGVVTVMTGENSLTGEYTKLGVTMAEEEINAAGGIKGQPLKVIIVDDQGTNTGALNAFNKLIHEEKVAVIIAPTYSTQCLAIKPEIERNKVLTFAGGLSAEITKDTTWMFRIRTSDAITPKFAAEYAIKELNFSKPAVIYVADDYGQGAKVAILDTLNELNIKPVAVNAIQTGDKDFTAQLVDIKQKNADCLITWVHTNEAGLIAKQVNRLGMEVQIIGCGSFISEAAIDLTGSASEGILTVSELVPQYSAPEWVKVFKDKYGTEPDYLSAWPYDAVKLISYIISQADSMDSEALREATLQVKGWKGISGEYTYNRPGYNPNDGFFTVFISKIGPGGKVNVIDSFSK